MITLKISSRLVVGIGVLLLLGGVSVWWFDREQSAPPLEGSQIREDKPKPAASEENPSKEISGSLSGFGEISAKVQNAMLSKPLEISGVVLDDQGRPLIGASVVYSSSKDGKWSQTKVVECGEDGSFQINGEEGTSMHVSALHDDYMRIPGTTGLVYPKGSFLKKDGSVDSGGFLTLVMRKKPLSAGLKAITARRTFEPPGWVATFDMGKGVTRAGAPTGEQEIGFYLELGEGATPNIESRFDWKVTVQVPRGGGAQWRTDPKDYEAPENGYEETLVASFNAEDTNWTYVAERNVFVRFADGTYGRLNFRLSAATKSLTLSSYHNPSGDRNLFP
jgi:hypothetical protein